MNVFAAEEAILHEIDSCREAGRPVKRIRPSDRAKRGAPRALPIPIDDMETRLLGARPRPTYDVVEILVHPPDWDSIDPCRQDQLQSDYCG